MHQPERNIGSTLSSGYRYSFQGQESDDEIKGEGNSINYTYRMHDPRVGRFFAVDPIASRFPHNSPYAFSENRVIDGIEWEGLEVLIIHLFDTRIGFIGTVSTSQGIMIDRNGIAKYTTHGTGLGLFVGGGISVGIGFSNAPEKEYLLGDGDSYGGGLIWFDGIEGTWDTSDECDGNYGKFAAKGWTITGGVGFEGGLYWESTTTEFDFELTWREIGKYVRDIFSEESTDFINAKLSASFEAFKSVSLSLLDSQIAGLKKQIEYGNGNRNSLSLQATMFELVGNTAKAEEYKGLVAEADAKISSMNSSLNQLQQDREKVNSSTYESASSGTSTGN